ncbi:MAG: WXG100 family type VII secretion target [Chloroflexi bacterium CFX4]|nr:WXG100 family type VII secretion target [Chloroflexi bacterium CFX4]MDL1922924.1 WXG100 family type VII secretion target [Chloroflexi bacterium CFX3]
MANLIRLVPDDLKAAMQVFTQRAEQLNGLHRQMESHLDRLRSGGWTGKGAESFFNEMQNLVSPALLRLIKALHDSTQSTQNLISVLQQAEEEAAMLFFGEGTFEEAGNGVGVVKNGGEMPVRYKPVGAGGGGGNREELDTLTGDQASALTRELNDRVGRFSAHMDGIAIIAARLAAAGYSLEEIAKSIFSLESAANFLTSLGLSGVVEHIGQAIQGWFAADFIGDIAGNTFEAPDLGDGANLAVSLGFMNAQGVPQIALAWLAAHLTGEAVGALTGRPDNIAARASERGEEFGYMFAVAVTGADSILTHINFTQISAAVDGALAGNPNASISGELYTNERGETYARITADGQEIYNDRVTAEAARVIDETFDRLGPNYTSESSFRQGANELMTARWSSVVYGNQEWSQGAITDTLTRAMNDPAMQDIVARLNQGEAITPAEVTAVMNGYAVGFSSQASLEQAVHSYMAQHYPNGINVPQTIDQIMASPMMGVFQDRISQGGSVPPGELLALLVNHPVVIPNFDNSPPTQTETAP